MIPRALALVLATTALLGCDVADPPPPTTCTRIGERCQRPDGPVGVCQEAPCPAGVAGPCFACTPQH